MYTYSLFMLRFDRKQNSVKQLSFNKKEGPGTHHLHPGVSFLAQGTPESQATLLSHRGLEKASKPTGWFLHPLTPSLSPYCAHCYKQALGGFTRKQNCPSLDLYGIHLPKERGTRSGQK